SPYYALFGIEPNVDSPMKINDYRFENLARAHRLIYDSQIDAKTYRHDQSLIRSRPRDLKVGHYVTLKNDEAITLSHIRDHGLRVVSIRGKVIGVQPVDNGSAAVKYFNVDRLREVPQDVSWTDIRPRPRRYRGPSDARTLTNADKDQFEVVRNDGLKLTFKRKHKGSSAGNQTKKSRYYGNFRRKRRSSPVNPETTKRVRFND
ncbi:MAG: hypothetical protein V2I33_17425, partial [Kangiellaceae bacterium]|nr:hypothetical protein [Kangiellaceae bacterium]